MVAGYSEDLSRCQEASRRILARWGCKRLLLSLDAARPLHPIAHDERGGPYPASPDGGELDGVLLSVTDEGGHLLHAWAWPDADSPVVGLGVDLASVADFDGGLDDQQFVELLLTTRERELVHGLWPTHPSLGYASAIAAHEAAFKATARPLRQWYRTHDEELFFEAMDFSLASSHTVAGDQRGGRAGKALERLGIGRIEVAFDRIGDMAFVLAVALAREGC